MTKNRKEKNKYQREHRKAHVEYYRKYHRDYYQKNKEKRIKYRKKYLEENKEKIKITRRKYFHRVEKHKPQNKLLRNLRRKLLYLVKKGNGNNKGHMIDLLCCSANFLKDYIEKQWTKGMSWNNHGNKRGQWNIDHIIPCESFDLRLIEEQEKCFHYTNLQPLWWIDNIRKSDKLPNGKHARHIYNTSQFS